MIKNASISALALVIGMALVLGACGSKGDGDVAGATANVTFTSSPNADIWIDGKASGTTPLTLALSAGSHKIAMKRNGFVEVSQALAVEAGKDITVDGALPVRGEDEAAFRRLLAMIDTEYVPFDKATTHRGGNSAVTLYYPSGDVRRTGLSTYRVEVSSAYDAEGYIEFRKGKKVLYREKFEPETYITEKALPAEVLEAARNGAKLSWGLTYDSKRRKRSEVKSKFSVIGRSRERKIEKRIDRTMDRTATRSASPLLREMTQIRLLVDQRLYSEALMRSLAVLNTWEDTMLPYSNMASALQRLKLKNSSLYQFVASKLLGAGGKRLLAGGSNYLRPNEARQGSGRNDRSIDGSNAAHDSAGRRSKLPVIAVAPKSKSAGASGGMSPGFGVRPTDQGDESSASGAAPGEADAASASSDTGVRARRGSERELARLRKHAEEAELRAAEAEQAERDLAAIEDEMAGKVEELGEADQALAQANEAAEKAQQAADDVAADASASDAAKQAAQAAADAAKGKRDTASEHLEALQVELNEMETNRPVVEEELRKIVERVGSSSKAGAEAARLRESLAQAEQNQSAGDPSARRSASGSTDVTRLHKASRAAESRAADAAQAEKTLATLPVDLDRKATEMAAAEQARQDATDAAREAHDAVAALVAGGSATPEQIAAAEAAAAGKEAEKDAVSERTDAMRDEFDRLQGEGQAALNAAQKTLKSTGTAKDAAAEAARLQRELAQAKSQTSAGGPSTADRSPGGTPVPGSASPKGHDRKGGIRQPLSHDQLVRQATGMQEGARSELDQARSAQEGALADAESAGKMAEEARTAGQKMSETELPAAAQQRDAKQQAHQDLVAAGSATQDQLDAAKADADAAQAEVDRVHAAVEQSQHDAAVADANEARAMIELERANAKLTRAEQDLQEADRKFGELAK